MLFVARYRSRVYDGDTKWCESSAPWKEEEATLNSQLVAKSLKCPEVQEQRKMKS